MSEPVIRHIFISPGHNFWGRHGQPAGEYPIQGVDEVRCVAGRGLEGDRYFDFKENYKGQITFFDWDVFRRVVEAVRAENVAPSAMRRNVIVEGIDLNALIGRRFSLQGVTFEGTEESRPCTWMNHAIGPGAEDFLKGQGGLRARILSDGVLRCGAANFQNL